MNGSKKPPETADEKPKHSLLLTTIVGLAIECRVTHLIIVDRMAGRLSMNS
jgi:hypothetical protein